jgi:transcriptional regulator with XRE-family HTH domain
MRNVTVNSIGEYIREQREQAKISVRQLAQSAGVSNPYLSQIERGLRKPSADILQQIAKGLRISAEALYVQAGILDDRQADTGVRSALLADAELSERQKQVLLEIYESFRRENAAAAENAEAAAPAELASAESEAGSEAESELAEAESELAGGAPGGEGLFAEAVLAEAPGTEGSNTEGSNTEGSNTEGSNAGAPETAAPIRPDSASD